MTHSDAKLDFRTIVDRFNDTDILKFYYKNRKRLVENFGFDFFKTIEPNWCKYYLSETLRNGCLQGGCVLYATIMY